MTMIPLLADVMVNQWLEDLYKYSISEGETGVPSREAQTFDISGQRPTALEVHQKVVWIWSAKQPSQQTNQSTSQKASHLTYQATRDKQCPEAIAGPQNSTPGMHEQQSFPESQCKPSVFIRISTNMQSIKLWAQYNRQSMFVAQVRASHK